MNYKHSMDCRHCPQNNTENGCPCWCEVVWTNLQTGEEKIIKNCLFQMLPEMLVEVIKASNRPSAAIESTRNEIVNGFLKLSNVFAQIRDRKALKGDKNVKKNS